MRIEWSKHFDYIKPRKNKFRKLYDTSQLPVCKQLQELQEKALLSNPAEKSGIYVFHSKVNDNIYIGSAINLEKRRQEHIDGLKMNEHNNWGFQMLYHKYGLDNLSFYIIEFCFPQECLKKESKYIQDYDPEINISGVRNNTLGFDFASMNEMEKIREEWYQTKEGFEYLRKRVGGWRKLKKNEPICQDMRNMWDKLCEKEMSEDEIVNEVLKNYKAWIPENLWKREVLIKFIKATPPRKSYY